MRKVLLLALLLNLTFCSKDDSDTESPIINLEAPVSNSSYKLGAEIHFEANLTDNVALKSYKIDIHDASGHTHKSVKEPSAWSFQKEFDISGKQNHIAHEHFEIPVDIKQGEYHFVIFCTDASGNEAVAYTNIYITE